MIPHTGSKQKDVNAARLYLPVPNKTWQHNELNTRGNTQLNRHDSTSSRRYSRWLIFKQWPTAILPKRKHHLDTHFYMRRGIHRGATEDTSIKHLPSIQAQMQTISETFLKLSSFMDSGVLFFPCTFLPRTFLPIPLFLYVLFLCCIYVVWFPFLHWPIVMPLTPPVWCRFGSVCLWTDSPLSNGANILLCGQSTVSWNWATSSNSQNKPAASQNQARMCGCTFLPWWWGCKDGKKKEKTEEREWVEAGVRGWRVASLLKTAPYLPTVSHASCVVL